MHFSVVPTCDYLHTCMSVFTTLCLCTDNGKPTYLLQTESLDDGNFISLRFVSVRTYSLHLHPRPLFAPFNVSSICHVHTQITALGHDFAAKYTGLEDTLSADLSRVKLKIHQKSLAGLLKYGITLIPSIKRCIMTTMMIRLTWPVMFILAM